MDPASPPEADAGEEERPGRFSSLEPHMRRMFVVLGVVLVVGILGGFLAGFLVEQNLAETNDAKATTNTPNAARKIGSVAGVVTEKATDSINIASSDGLLVKITLFAGFGVKKAVKASPADITVGSEVLQSGSEVGKGKYDAAEIIVVPGDSKFTGLKVTAVKGDKVSALQPDQTPVTVNVKSTTAVYKLDASSATRIAKGSKVMANGLGVAGRGTFFANEIIILAPGSAFAKR